MKNLILLLLHHLSKHSTLAKPSAFLIDFDNACPFFHGHLMGWFVDISYTCGMYRDVDSSKFVNGLGYAFGNQLLVCDINCEQKKTGLGMSRAESVGSIYKPWPVCVCKAERGHPVGGEPHGALSPDTLKKKPR